MAQEIEWFSSMAKRRVTVTEVAQHLDVSRKTATNRLEAGLSADDLIVISRALDLSPIHALVELGAITHEEAFEFVDGDGQLLHTASPEQLVYRLAEDMLSPADKVELGGVAREFIERELSGRATPSAKSNVRQLHPTPDVQRPAYDADIPDDAVADSSPEVGGTLDDLDP